MNLPVRIPDRNTKPRTLGRTHLIDKGLPVGVIDDQMRVGGEYVDLVKLGWGTSVVTPNLSEKLDMYRSHDIEVCFGGTLFELAHLQDRVDEYVAWLRELNITVLEVSDGVLEMEGSAKVEIIEKFSTELTVFSEVGSKDAAAIVTPARWVRAIKDDLAAGAAMVILEGRESGTAGMYRESGEIRMGLIDEILESGIPVDRLVFEAPTKAQQVWLINHIGPDVNLGKHRSRGFAATRDAPSRTASRHAAHDPRPRGTLMTARPKLLVLGAGRHQAALIQRAESRGIAVVASDYYPDAPGKRYASFPADLDALDVGANVALARNHDVAGVITTGTDMAVVTMAEVAAALDLPCYLTPMAARVATDKVLMAEAFARNDVRRPTSYEVFDDRVATSRHRQLAPAAGGQAGRLPGPARNESGRSTAELAPGAIADALR